MLAAAMLAPAILALGMLAAELSGYEATVRAQSMERRPAAVVRAAPPAAQAGQPRSKAVRPHGKAVRPGMRAVQPAAEFALPTGQVVLPVVAVLRPAVLRPMLVPPPPHPDRFYEGLLPAPFGVVRRLVRPPQATVAPERPGTSGRPRAEPKAEEPSATFTCEREWQETWLWEACRERAWNVA